MKTKVMNLITGEEQFYSCNPQQAVISAYALENNLATQLATGYINNMKLPIRESERVITCGEWTAIKKPNTRESENGYI